MQPARFSRSGNKRRYARLRHAFQRPAASCSVPDVDPVYRFDHQGTAPAAGGLGSTALHPCATTPEHPQQRQQQRRRAASAGGCCAHACARAQFPETRVRACRTGASRQTRRTLPASSAAQRLPGPYQTRAPWPGQPPPPHRPAATPAAHTASAGSTGNKNVHIVGPAPRNAGFEALVCLRPGC